MMKGYFEKTNGNNIVILTDGITAKIFDAAPSGVLDGIDLYAEGAAERLRDKYSDLWVTDRLPEYSEMHSGNEVEFDDALAEELENAELFFDDSGALDVEFSGGESRSNPGAAVDYMLVEVNGIELYAEVPAGDDEANYGTLVSEIVDQARANGIDPRYLRFFYW